MLHKKQFWLMLFLLLGVITVGHAQAVAPTQTPTANVAGSDNAAAVGPQFSLDLSVDPQEWTLSDFLGASETFNFEKPQFQKTMQTYADLQTIQKTFDDLQSLLDAYRLNWRSRLGLSSWGLTEVMKFKSEMSGLMEMSAQEKQNYFDFIKTTDDLSASLKGRKSLFEKFYRKAQQDPALRTQSETMRGYAEDVNGLMREIQKLQINYAKIYNERSKVFDTLDVFSGLVDEEIHYFREMRFAKTQPGFYEAEFLSFFDASMSERLKVSFAKILDYPLADWQSWGLYLAEFLLVALLLGWGLGKVRKPEENRLVFAQPFALAFVLTLLIFKGVTQGMTPLGSLLFWLGLIFAVQWLLSSMVRKEADRRGLRALIFIYGFLQVTNVVGIPQVLYRILLIVMALILLAYAWREVRQKTQNLRKTRLRLMRALLLLCLATIGAEFLGYHLLAVLLFHGTLQSVFAVFVVWQLRYMFVKILFSLFTLWEEKGVTFFKNFKIILVKKLRFLSDVIGLIFLFGLFLSIWGIYPGLWAGVKGFWGWGLSFQDYHITLGNILQASLVVYLTHFASYLITHYLDEVLYPRRNIPVGSAKAMNALINYFAWVIGLFFAVSSLGFALQQFAIIAGALSVGIGFGLQNIVNNFVSGLILLFERPIKVGDIVDLNGDMGVIEKVGLRSTIIRTASKTQMIIPNSDFITQRVINMTLTDRDYRVRVAVNVTYGTDPELVKSILLAQAATLPEVLPKPAPQALLTKIGDSALSFELFVWIGDVNNRMDVASQLHFKIESEFRKHNIKLPTSQAEVKAQKSVGVV